MNARELVEDAFIRYSTVRVVCNPSKTDYDAVRWRFQHATDGMLDEGLEGCRRNPYEDSFDLVSLGRPLEGWAIRQMLRRYVPEMFPASRQKSDEGIYYSSDKAFLNSVILIFSYV